jgi:sugar (pentulose or hexulose) kinase
MEACCCELQECLDIIRSKGVPVESVRSLGGAARSDLWLQIKADMLGVPVERPLCSDAASLGAAMLAAFGIGQFRSIEEAVDAWYHPAVTFEPNPVSYSCYREVYNRYLDLYHRLYES